MRRPRKYKAGACLARRARGGGTWPSEVDLVAVYHNSFTAAARAAGLITGTQTFDPYANENNFLLAAFIFEDVGVTAYKGAAPLISNKTYLEAAAGILAVEAYHAATIRAALYERGLAAATNKISNARDSLDGASDLDQGTARNGMRTITPVDGNSIAFSRSAGQVLIPRCRSPRRRRGVSRSGTSPIPAASAVVERRGVRRPVSDSRVPSAAVGERVRDARVLARARVLTAGARANTHPGRSRPPHSRRWSAGGEGGRGTPDGRARRSPTVDLTVLADGATK